MGSSGIVILHPPVLPYGYTLHHRFQKVWEVAQYVRRFHPRTTVVDAGLLNMLQGEVLHRITPDCRVLAVYVEPQMIEVTRQLVSRSRMMNPDLRILLYGPASGGFSADLRAVEPDAVGQRGDYEQQILEFVDWVLEGTAPTLYISVRTEQGWSRPAGQFDYLPPSDWAYPPLGEMPLADIGRIYEMKRQPTTMAVTVARGCPFPCTFCSTPSIEGHRDRRRPIDGLVAYLRSHPEVSDWQFYAPTFTLNRRWCMQLFDAMRGGGLETGWRCSTRADYVDDELAGAMAATGCRSVGIGVETLGPTQAILRKGLNSEVITEAVRAFVDRGVTVKCYVLMGLPGQTVAEVRETLDFVTALGALPRPTLYSPQGDSDALVGMGLAAYQAPTALLDRKSFVPQGAEYGEFLRVLYQS